MSATSHPELHELLRFQALARLRWRSLLGHPGLARAVAESLQQLERRDPALGRLVQRWLAAAGALRRRAARAATAFRAATRELAAYASSVDRFGRAAEALRAATQRALSDRPSVAELAHLQIVEHVFAQYLEARNRLITRNLGLVRMAVARLAIPSHRRDDMVQEGVFGLVRALERYDPGRSTRFSTYAMYWIRTEIMRALLASERAVRVPNHVLHDRRLFTRRLAALDRGQPADVLREQARVAAGLSERRLSAVEAVPDGGPVRLVDEPMASADPVDAVEWGQVLEVVMTHMSTLSPRERVVLEHRFELARPFRTLKELALELGISREGVRKVQITALAKLRDRIDAPASERAPLADRRHAAA